MLFSTPIRRTSLILFSLYFVDFLCIFFLPSSTEENYWTDYSSSNGTADLWICFFCRFLFAVTCCLYVYLKTFYFLVDDKENKKSNDNTNNNNQVFDETGHIQDHVVTPSPSSEKTPLLQSSSTTSPAAIITTTTIDENDDEDITDVSFLKRLLTNIKDLDFLKTKWQERHDYKFSLTILFVIEFLLHVASNIYIAIKSLEYQFDEVPKFSPGMNSSTSISDNSTSTTTTFTSTAIGSTSTTLLPDQQQEIIPSLEVPPTTWVAILISSLIFWSTGQLYAMHFYFSAIKKTKKVDTDVPAIPLIHPHQLIYEADTVLSRCNICNERFKPKQRKFRCETCDFYACSTCVDSKVHQWMEKKTVEQEKTTTTAASTNDENANNNTSDNTTSPSTPAAALAPSKPKTKTNNTIIVGSGDKIVTETLTKMQLIKELFSITKGFRSILLASAIVLLSGTAINIWVPKIQGNVIDAIIGKDMHAVKIKLILFAALGLGRLCLSSIRTYFSMIATRLAINSLRTRVFKKILNRDMGFFDATATGVLQSRLTTDTNSMLSPLSVIINQVAANIALLFGASFMSFFVSWQLSLLSFSVLGPIIYATSMYAELSRVLNRQTFDLLAASTSEANTAFANIRTVQAFGTEPLESKKYAKAMNDTIKVAIINSLYSAGLVFVNSSLDLFIWALTLGFGGYIILNHPERLTIGELITFQLYVNMLNSAYRALSDSINVLTKASGAAERVFTIMRSDPSSNALRKEDDEELFGEDGGDVDVNHFNCSSCSCCPCCCCCSGDNNNDSAQNDINNNLVGEYFFSDARRKNTHHEMLSFSGAPYIKFQDVEFIYPTRPAATVLKGLTLDIVPGKVLALSGESGGGKSSIMNLLLLFYQIQSGAIQVGFPNQERFARAEHEISAMMKKKGEDDDHQKNKKMMTITDRMISSESYQSDDNNNNNDDEDDDEENRARNQLLHDESNYDFKSIYELHRRDWLRDIAIVSQDTQLFNTTILENICYGVPAEILYGEEILGDEIDNINNVNNTDSSYDTKLRLLKEKVSSMTQKEKDEIKLKKASAVAQAAQAHEFIEKLPDKYFTPVGDIGKTLLSGGQKQRLAIARALLRRPKLLLLDEASSALDTESESKVQEAIDKMLRENKKSRNPMTCVIIAHRLSTIQNADRILVIKDGKKHQEGTHQSLLKDEEGMYAQFVKAGFPKPAEGGNGAGGGDKKKDFSGGGRKKGGSGK